MSKRKLGIATLLLVYVGAISGLALMGGFATGLLSAGSPAQQSFDATVLKQRITNAREIKEALSKPLPQVEPLPPISSKLANAAVVHASRAASKSNTLSAEALNAMAMGKPRTVSEAWCLTNPGSCQPTASRPERIAASPEDGRRF